MKSKVVQVDYQEDRENSRVVFWRSGFKENSLGQTHRSFMHTCGSDKKKIRFFRTIRPHYAGWFIFATSAFIIKPGIEEWSFLGNK